jgi:hypothetical protein
MFIMIGAIDTTIVIANSLACGMWWVLPHTAVACSRVSSDFKQGAWARESRVACKIAGACSRFRMPIDVARVKRCIVSHINMVFPYRHTVMSSKQHAAGVAFANAKRTPPWGAHLCAQLGLGSIQRDRTLFHIVQLAVILMHHGMDKSWVFWMMETHMDLLIHATTRRHRWFRKITFREVVQEALRSPLAFRFLYTFDSAHTYFINGHKKYNMMVRIMRCADVAGAATCMERMPPVVRAGTALLALTCKVRKNKIVTRESERKFAAFIAYLE